MTKDRSLDRSWQVYGNSGRGWTGGDSVHAYRLGPDRVLWSFADSFLGPLEPNGSRAGGPIYHSMFVLEGPRSFSVVLGGTAKHRLPLVVAHRRLDSYLGLAGILRSGRFQEIFMERRHDGPGTLDSVPLRTVVATFSLPKLSLVREHTVVGHPGPVQWGSAILRLGRWTYVYGASSSGVDKQMYVARVAGDDLDSAWQYDDKGRWSPQSAAATPIYRGVEAEYSVSVVDGMIVLVTSAARRRFSNRVDVDFGCSAVGPFRQRASFAASYAVGALGAKLWHNANVYVYDAADLPSLNSGSTLVIAYDRNSLNFYAIFHNAALYRPSYLKVRIGY